MDIVQLLRQRVVVFDGPYGTELQQRGLPGGEPPETWILQKPEEVIAIHVSYLEAGPDVIHTNTFGANRIRLSRFGLGEQVQEINRKAVALAREAIRRTGRAEVIVEGNIGPTGELLEPLGDLTSEAALEAFTEQAQALAEAGADFLHVKTMTSLEEALLALKAALGTGLPVIVSMAYHLSHKGAFTMMGVEAGKAVETFEREGASAVGANCEVQIQEMVEIVKAMRGRTSLPIVAQPNGGKPTLQEGTIVYPETPESFTSHVPALIEAGANAVGACCGARPSFIRMVVESVGKR
ncbi:MAG: homocysteine S-methyltransferase family protein [candidate division NC10 bacterium]|nr:homocysteine S-methyltransferase family protein [candidate division NC10 bacterium]